MTNIATAPETKKAMVFLVPHKGREFMVAKLTLQDMGFDTEKSFGDLQDRARDMGLSHLTMEELKAFRDFYHNQKIGEHLLATVSYDGCNLWMLENHVPEGIGIRPFPAQHDSVWSPENIFCFKKK